MQTAEAAVGADPIASTPVTTAALPGHRPPPSGAPPRDGAPAPAYGAFVVVARQPPASVRVRRQHTRRRSPTLPSIAVVRAPGLPDGTRASGLRDRHCDRPLLPTTCATSRDRRGSTGKAIMATQTRKPTTKERAWVDVRKPAEVVGWCNKWRVTPERLKAAVAEVGTSAPAVARALGRPY